MKKLLSAFLSMTLILALAAGGGDGGGSGAPAGKEAPDLNQFYEDFMTSLGEDNQPAMMDVEADLIPQVYPGLEDYELKQSVLKTPMISSVAFEIALVELADASKAQEVADIFQARIDYQVETGAYYPATVESWEKAQVITQGSVVALICAGSEQDQAVEAFNKLFA